MSKGLLGKAKKVLSSVIATAMVAPMIPAVSIAAENVAEKYPYTMFAASAAEGAITVNAGNFCVNGDVASNGTIVSSGNMNVNGTKTENKIAIVCVDIGALNCNALCNNDNIV